VTERLNVVGTASSGNLDHWELEYQPTNASDDDWVLYKKGTASVTNGVLAVFDPTLLLNGAYRVQLGYVNFPGVKVVGRLSGLV
jgi:hypothetical protein